MAIARLLRPIMTTSEFRLILLTALTSCATNATRPEAMTAARHDEVARVEAQRADDELTKARTACPGYETQDACYRYWSSVRSPTKKHFERASKHRALAEKHRAASDTLRMAEANACAGIPDADRDLSPFFHTEDIVDVEKMPSEVRGGVYTGLRVTFKPLPGMTADWLQKVVDCHLARNAVIGHEETHLAYCPLTLPRVTAIVHPVPRGLAVEIQPHDETGSRALAARGEELGRAVAGPER